MISSVAYGSLYRFLTGPHLPYVNNFSSSGQTYNKLLICKVLTFLRLSTGFFYFLVFQVNLFRKRDKQSNGWCYVASVSEPLHEKPLKSLFVSFLCKNLLNVMIKKYHSVRSWKKLWNSDLKSKLWKHVKICLKTLQPVGLWNIGTFQSLPSGFANCPISKFVWITTQWFSN